MATTPGARAWTWDGVLPDALRWVAGSDDPAARWALLTGVDDRPPDDPEVIAARRAMLADPATTDLLARLSPWDGGGPLSGHNQPAFAPNLLTLLADRGVRAGDDPRVDGTLDTMLEHQEEGGRFEAFATALLLTVLHRVEDLAPDVRAVDLRTLPSSKGGTGVPPTSAGRGPHLHPHSQMSAPAHRSARRATTDVVAGEEGS